MSDGQPRLLRVIPVVRHLVLDGGGSLVVIALEIWQDWLAIPYLEAPPMDPSPARFSPPQWQVEDDVGTTYRAGAGGSRGGGQYLRGTVSFVPPPPTHASLLRITPPRVTEGAFVVPMS